MTQAPISSREHLTRAVGSLRARLAHEATTQLIDFAGAHDDDLQELLELADGLLAVVVLRLRYDAAYQADGPPSSRTDLNAQVLAHASKLVRGSVRGADLVMRIGQRELAVVLLRAGPLEARAQIGRLSLLTAEQRFEHKGFDICWRGRLSLATRQFSSLDLDARQALQALFNAAN